MHCPVEFIAPKKTSSQHATAHNSAGSRPPTGGSGRITHFGRGTVSAPWLQRAFMDNAKNTRIDKAAAHRIQGAIIAKCTS
jgi:hypothetical protein